VRKIVRERESVRKIVRERECEKDSEREGVKKIDTERVKKIDTEREREIERKSEREKEKYSQREREREREREKERRRERELIIKITGNAVMHNLLLMRYLNLNSFQLQTLQSQNATSVKKLELLLSRIKRLKCTLKPQR
jgi:hypothetical protein